MGVPGIVKGVKGVKGLNALIIIHCHPMLSNACIPCSCMGVPGIATLSYHALSYHAWAYQVSPPSWKMTNAMTGLKSKHT